jgi:hypothetical protein
VLPLLLTLKLFNLVERSSVWHKGFKRYKFPEFAVLDKVLRELVDAFLNQFNNKVVFG